MPESPSQPPAGRRRAARSLTPAGILAGLVGLILFAWAIRDAGAHHVLDGLRRIGAGFLLILLISSTRPLARTVAWLLCIEDTGRLPLVEAFKASITGTALGDLTPLGVFLSEPAKAVLVRNHINLMKSFSALTVENLFYSVTVALMIMAGTGVFLVSFPVPPDIRTVSLLLLAATAGAAIVTGWVLHTRRRVASGLLDGLCRRRIARGYLQPRLAHVRELEDRVFGFASRHQGRLLPIWLLEASFHVSAVAEVWVVLYLLGASPTFLTAFVLEYVDRVITVTFKFIPLRLGVDEAGTGLATDILGMGTAAGVALAIIRKARVLFWTALGVLFLMRRGLSIRGTLEQADAVVEAGK